MLIPGWVGPNIPLWPKITAYNEENSAEGYLLDG